MSSSGDSSSLSDTDSDDLMISQELRPGFSSDRDVSTGGGCSHKDGGNHNSPDARREVDRPLDAAVDTNGQLGGQFAQ